MRKLDTLIRRIYEISPKQVAKEVNKKFPGNDLRYDGESPTYRGNLYQFTPYAGKAKGMSLSVFKLDPKELIKKLKEKVKSQSHKAEAHRF